jgi:hypothetical protein
VGRDEPRLCSPSGPCYSTAPCWNQFNDDLCSEVSGSFANELAEIKSQYQQKTAEDTFSFWLRKNILNATDARH